MSKAKIITIAIVVIVIIAAAVLGWWYFSRANRVISWPGGAVTKVKSSEKSITSFAFVQLGSGVSEVADSINHTVTLVVPGGTDITNLAPTILVSASATVSPSSGAAENFTNPVVYTVTAEDGSTQTYTVTVKAATPQDTGGS